MKELMKIDKFNSKLATVIGNATRARDTIQELLMDGFTQAMPKDQGGHENYARLTTLVTACVGVKSLPTRTIQSYIRTYARVRWVKPENEEGRYKKDGDGGVTLPEVSWYEWVGNENATAKKDYDLITAMRSIIKKAEKAAKEEHLKNSEEAAPLLKKLEELAGQYK